MDQKLFFLAIVDIKRTLLSKNNLFLSVYMYGSVTRLEAIDGISDIDLLFVYEKKLEREHVEFLIDLKEQIKKKYGIPLHTRLRRLEDLLTGRSGLMDCGFTSSINKLRDGIVLHGINISNYYYSYIKQSSEQTIQDNLRNRWCEICYRNMDIFQHETTQKKQLLYVLSSMSELICYSQGIFSLGTKDSLEKAYQITELSILNNYWQLKRGETEITDICTIIEKNAETIDIYASPKKWKNLLHLKEISLVSVNQDELFMNYSVLEKDELIRNDLTPKRCEIQNDKLIIYHLERD